mmetsp:Transcript_9404/g.11601  ORF Transcript_9404/g.11601 Transcript_9404/m.11601 type:complete len:164 (+) Transcript_9404:71-562(+)
MGSKKKKSSKKKQAATTKQVKHTKKGQDHQSEALLYLSAWANRENTPNTWKFKKNIQTWLIHHMYDADKISKSSFEIMLEYLKDLKGGTRSRVSEDATKRALRYKAYEKKAERDGEKENVVETEGDEPIVDSDESRWKDMDDHEKRKEYKRARKIIEILRGCE